MRRLLPLLSFLLFAGGCSAGRAESKAPPGSTAALPGKAASLERGPRIVRFEGTCDASGAVPIDERHFAVADDENNVLRIYDAETGGAPRHADDVSLELALSKKKKQSEADFEAATRLGDTALWLSSHARSKKGKPKQARLQYFATRLPRIGEPIFVKEQAYEALLADMLASPELADVGVRAAADKAPQVAGGLNIEGMTAMPDGRVLLGFRNPVPRGRALLVALENPLEPFAGTPARFAAPISLDLAGRGVRGLSFWRGRYLIAAGHRDEGGQSRLYVWHGPASDPVEITGAVPRDFNPEAFFTPEERDDFMLLSDDGSRTIEGKRCKDLDDARKKSFRGAWLALAEDGR